MNTRNKTKSFYRITKEQLENLIAQVADGECGAVGVFVERDGRPDICLPMSRISIVRFLEREKPLSLNNYQLPDKKG